MHNLLRRKINILLIAICIFLCTTIKAQKQQYNEFHDDKFIHFGINLGYNRSSFNFTRHPIFVTTDSLDFIESINNSGLNLAWLVNVRLSNYFSFRTYPLNLTFTEKAFQYGVKYPLFPAGPLQTKKVQSITLALPAQIKFSSDRIHNFKFYTFLGARGEYDMASNAGARRAGNLIKIRRFDFGPETGIGFHFYFPYFVLSPEVRVNWGIPNIHAYDPNLVFSNNIDKINSRQITFSITVE